MDMLRQLFTRPEFAPITVTVLLLILGTIGYVYMRRRILDAGEGVSSSKTRLTLLAMSGLVLLLIVLARIWQTTLIGLLDLKADGNTPDLVDRTFWTLITAAIVYLAGFALRRSLLKDVTSIELRHKIRRGILWGGVGVFFLAAALIWANLLKDAGTFLGIVGAGVALALSETLLCIAGWALIVVRRPFDIGDRIEVNGRIGDVIDIGLFQSSLLEVGNWVKAEQSTGRMLILPNSMVYRHPVFNYTKGFPFIWNEVSTTVTFESDWREAKAIMQKQAEEEADRLEAEVRRLIAEMQSQYAIHYEELRPILYTSIDPHGVCLTLRYLAPVRMRRATTHRISENILGEFIKHPQIDFAYPTTRIFRNNEEGKADLGGPPHGEPVAPGPHALG